MKRKYLRGIYLIERTGGEVCTNEPTYYIGQSIDLFIRLENHFTTPNGQEIDRAIAKIGIENFKCSILALADTQKERNQLEQEWIKRYADKYGEAALYNRTTGGKSESKKLNDDRDIISKDIRDKISKVFESCIDFPIYLLAEKFELSFSDIINIRKPILRKTGMHYDIFKRRCVITKTREVPAIWRAGQYTNNQIKLYLEFENQLETETLSEKLNSSIADLRDFKLEYNNFESRYIPAEECLSKEEMSLLD